MRRQITHVQTDDQRMFGEPRGEPRSHPLRLVAPGQVVEEPALAPPPVARDLDATALSNLEREVAHAMTEVNVMARVDVLPEAAPAPLLAEAVQRQDELLFDLHASVMSNHAEGERLREAAARIESIYQEQKARLEAAYQRAIAPVLEELDHHTRNQAQLRRDLDRRFARLQPKRPSRKRA